MPRRFLDVCVTMPFELTIAFSFFILLSFHCGILDQCLQAFEQCQRSFDEIQRIARLSENHSSIEGRNLLIGFSFFTPSKRVVFF